MNYLKVSTGVSVILGPFVNYLSGATNLGEVLLAGTTPGLLKSNSSVSVSLGGRNWQPTTGGTTGYYELGLTSTDTNVTGALTVSISGASLSSNSFLEVWKDFQVLSADAYNTMHGIDIEETFDFYEMTKIMFSVLTGKSTGGGTDTLGFRDVADGKDRLSVTVDVDGNRTAVGTRDGS